MITVSESFFADFLVAGKLIVELKAVSAILPEHEVQTVNYLTATGIDEALILNFGTIPIGIRSKTRIYEMTKKQK